MFHFKHKNLIVRKLYYATYRNNYYYIDIFNVQVCSKCGKVNIVKDTTNCYSWNSEYKDNLKAIKNDPIYEDYTDFIDKIYSKEDVLNGIKNNKNIKSQEKIQNAIKSININK